MCGRARARRQVNAQWRSHQGGQRRQHKEQVQQLQVASKKLSKLDSVTAQRDGLRELLRERSKQLVACWQRCAELEMTAKQLKEALAQAMNTLRPEVLDRR